MTYFLTEDTKISGKWIQLISQRMDIMDLSDSQPVSQSVCLDRQTDLYNSLNDLFLSRRYKNIRKMDSTYITKYGYNELVSQPVSHSVSLPLTDRLTSARQ